MVKPRRYDHSCRLAGLPTLLIWELLFIVGCLSVFGPLCLWFARQPWRSLLSGGAAGLLVMGCFVYLPRLYQGYRYCFTERGLMVFRGVLFRRQQLLRFDRMIYLSVYRTPAFPFLRLCGVVIALPGMKLRLYFLSPTAAEQLSAKINAALEQCHFEDSEKGAVP